MCSRTEGLPPKTACRQVKTKSPNVVPKITGINTTEKRGYQVRVPQECYLWSIPDSLLIDNQRAKSCPKHAAEWKETAGKERSLSELKIQLCEGAS